MRFDVTPKGKRARGAVLAASAGLFFLSAAGLAFGQAAPPPPQFAPPPASSYQQQADARQDRLEELEAQVRASTAENERLQFELMQAEREITRLRAMVGDLASTNQTLAESAEQQVQQREAAAATQQQAPAQGGLNAAQQAATGELGQVTTSAPAPAGDPAEAFRAAQQLLLNNRIAEAEASFGAFLRDYPNAAEAPDAQFWYAYALLARNNYAEARDGFLTFLQRHSNHNRAAEAQVRLGMALVGLGETRTACAAFRDLPANSARAVRDLAAREARAASCS